MTLFPYTSLFRSVAYTWSGLPEEQLYDADGKCFAMNKMGGSILALALTGLSAEGIADALRHYFNGTPTQSRDEVAAWLDEMEASGFLNS